MEQRRTTSGRHSATGPASTAAWGLGLMLYPLGTRRMSRAALVRRWYMRAANALSVDYDAWFMSATVGVVDAMIGFGEIGEAIERLVVARANDGFTLADTATDLGCLVAAAPARLRLRLEQLDLPRILAVAWPEPTLVVVADAPALGGLAARVRDACGRTTARLGNAAGPTLLVIEGDPDERDRLAVASVRWIDELFPAAEVLGAVAPGRFLAVVHSHAPVPDPAQLLQVVLQSSPVGLAGVRSEPWPADVDDALALVSGLAVPEQELVSVGGAAPVIPLGRPRIAAVARVGRIARDTRTLAASGIAAAVAFALMIGGGVHGPAATTPNAAARPPASTAPAASSPVTNSSATVSGTAASASSAVRPSSGSRSATPPIGGPPTNGGAANGSGLPPVDHGNDDGQGAQGSSPLPPLVNIPVGEPPTLGELDTQVRKLRRLVEQTTPDATGLMNALANVTAHAPAQAQPAK